MTRACENCRFSDTDAEKVFYCRRGPPSIHIVSGEGLATLYPRPGPRWWCGEYKLSWKKLFRRSNGPRA